jgi:hypothetical protein
VHWRDGHKKFPSHARRVRLRVIRIRPPAFPFHGKRSLT